MNTTIDDTYFRDSDPEKAHETHDATPDEMAADPEISWSGPAQPGSFPDYTAPTVESADFPPTEIIRDTPVSTRYPDVFDDGHLDRFYTNYPSPTRAVGTLARVTTMGSIANPPTDANTIILYQGEGVLYGFTVYAADALAGTPFVVLSDSIDGNGAVLTIIDTTAALAGYVALGYRGISFTRGISVAAPGGLTGLGITIIPVIERRVPTEHGRK